MFDELKFLFEIQQEIRGIDVADRDLRIDGARIRESWQCKLEQARIHAGAVLFRNSEFRSGDKSVLCEQPQIDNGGRESCEVENGEEAQDQF